MQKHHQDTNFTSAVIAESTPVYVRDWVTNYGDHMKV